MTYYDHITALRLRTGQWAEPRPLRSHERELAEMAANQRDSGPERRPSAADGGLSGWLRTIARVRA